MSTVEIGYFGVALFLALFFLVQWKRRHDKIASRVNRGLRGYVSGKPKTKPVTLQAHDEEEDGLIVA